LRLQILVLSQTDESSRILLSLLLAYITLIAFFASAVFSPGIESVSKQFHVSPETGVLGISLYVLGFAFGPIVWAPLSEISGRRLPLLIGTFGFSVFSTGVATAKDYQTIMLCRFFAGFFAASPLAVVPACFADLYDNRQRGTAITAFAMAVFMGPFAYVTPWSPSHP
jgi:MFS transporter, DHA1 family, multidrug resistance protein